MLPYDYRPDEPAERKEQMSTPRPLSPEETEAQEAAQKPVTLYTIRQDMDFLLANLQPDEDGVITDEDKDALEAVEAKFEDKLINIGYYCKNLDAENDVVQSKIDVYKAEIAKLERNIEANKNKKRSLGDWSVIQMEATGIKRVKRPDITVRMQKSPLKVLITDPVALEDKWIKRWEETRVMKKEIGQHFRQTKEAPKGTKVVTGHHLVVV